MTSISESAYNSCYTLLLIRLIFVGFLFQFFIKISFLMQTTYE